MLTEKGEYSTQAEINNDKDATVKRGIPYYQMALDSLANEFAEQMNALNQAQGVTGAGDLFMNRDNPGDKITAGNIAISKDWAEGKVHMLSSTDPNAPSDDRSNLARFLEVFSKEHRIDPSDIRQGAVGSSVSMSFEDWLLRTQSTLAEDQMGTTAKLNNYLTVNNTVYTDRDSVSGVDLNDEQKRNGVFDQATFRVRYLDETSERLHGTCIINLAKIQDPNDWGQIRGKKIATVFQDPMTSLNPIITIGKQITSVIMKHQNVSEVEARAQALELMEKVGIPNAEQRFDDYPFQYSGGMRQRIVIAIALSCRPKILICDEPTTALDVTIQAQILKLIKDLQKEYNYTIVFITHDLGVVANIADRVAVLYAGQIIEFANVEELFYDPRHPYTWALLSSLPQLAERNTKLFSITGTPPSLYNKIIGDPFAPRNQYCLKIDTLEEPPMFKVTDTHYAKTWLLDPRAPKTEKPEAIQNIHEKLLKAYNL